MGGAEGVGVVGNGQVKSTSGFINITGVGGAASALAGGDVGMYIADGLIQTTTGPISLNGIGGTGSSPYNWGTLILTSSLTPNIQSTIDGSISIVGASGAGAPDGILVIGYGLQTNGVGSISLSSTEGDVTIGSAMFPLPYPADSIVESTGSGSISIISARDIFISGDSRQPNDAYVRITGPAGDIYLNANETIDISGGGSNTFITNAGSGNITFVVDNAVSVPSTSIFDPGFGTGEFNLYTGGVISAMAGSEVRIYTAMPTQNTVLEPINGTVFTPGTFGVDDSYEQYSIYFPAGTYIGPEFMFFYKDIFVPPPFSPNQLAKALNQSAVNESQLPGLIPFQYFSSPFLIYQGRFCKAGSSEAPTCPSGYIKFASFIFENNVY